ncbi:MAG: ATP-binding protein [bacterium]|nr:ATP-binding protein [Betaproteobacteria bacterium]
MSGPATPASIWLSSRRFKYAVVLLIGFAAVLLFLLSTATANTQLFANHYRQLLTLNAGLVVALLVLIGFQLWGLRRKLRSGVFGSKLAFRLAIFFSLVAVLPGALVYAVSVQFTSRSIESWFDVKLDKALEGALSLGRSTLDGSLRELSAKAQSMASALSDKGPVQQQAALNELRDQHRVDEAALFSPRGTVLAVAGTGVAVMPELPVGAVMRQVRAQQPHASIESLPEKGLYLRVVVPVNTLSLTDDIRALQVLQQVAPELAAAAETVQVGYQDYQELLLSRTGLKQLYGMTLTLTLLLGLLGAFALAIFLSEQLASPLSILAEGTAAVARGDFSQRATVASGDELGVLTGSFNAMTRQLDEVRAANQRTQAEIETAKAYLESVLGNLSSGVMSFDAQFRLRAANRSASVILGVELGELLGAQLTGDGDGTSPLALLGHELHSRFNVGEAGDDARIWEVQVEYGAKGARRMLLLRGSHLRVDRDHDRGHDSDVGYVVVFDDVTGLMQAQRDAAWGEVARRLAHEIKNPLTPIQLSAERLHHKLASKLDTVDAQMLERSTRTIVNQVSALKSMVDAFSEYARSKPDMVTSEIDLNQLAREVLGLYESGSSAISIDAELAAGLPKVIGSPTQLRQVLHNLLQNAQDALGDVAAPRIVVRTELAPAGSGARACVRLSVIDNGCGFPPSILERVFEPYVTSKPKGTGLGLAIVKKIIEEHRGSIEVGNAEPSGARVSFTVPVAAARSDRSGLSSAA